MQFRGCLCLSLSARANIAENQCAQGLRKPKKMDHRQLESENEGEMAGFNEPGLVRLITNSDEKETRLFPGMQFLEDTTTNHETN